MATAAPTTDFTPLFQESLDFVKDIVVETELKHDMRMLSEDLAELLLDTIRNMDNTAMKRKWMRVRKIQKRETALTFAEEANAIRQNTGWKW